MCGLVDAAGRDGVFVCSQPPPPRCLVSDKNSAEIIRIPQTDERLRAARSLGVTPLSNAAADRVLLSRIEAARGQEAAGVPHGPPRAVVYSAEVRV